MNTIQSLEIQKRMKELEQDSDNPKNDSNLKEMDVVDKHQKKIAIDTVKNPMKGTIMGGMSEEEAIRVLKDKFGYTDRQIQNLQRESTVESKDESMKRIKEQRFTATVNEYTPLNTISMAVRQSAKASSEPFFLDHYLNSSDMRENLSLIIHDVAMRGIIDDYTYDIEFMDKGQTAVVTGLDGSTMKPFELIFIASDVKDYSESKKSSGYNFGRIKRQDEQKLNEKSPSHIHVTYETRKYGYEVIFQFDMRNGDVHIYGEDGDEVGDLYGAGIENPSEVKKIKSMINTFSTIALNPSFDISI